MIPNPDCKVQCSNGGLGSWLGDNKGGFSPIADQINIGGAA